MTPLDERDVYELEQALGNLASNPSVSPEYRGRLEEMRRAVGRRRVAGDEEPLTDRDLDRFEYVMTRLHTLVEAKRKDLELELKQYDRREKKITELLDAVEQKRKEREKAGASKGSRTRSSGEESSSDPE
jgi:hypothetical protein